MGDTFARNVDKEDYGGERSTHLVFRRNNYPKLFKMSESEQDELSRVRHDLSVPNCNECLYLEGSTSNAKYWAKYVTEVTPGDLRRHCISSINWETAKRHGQDKWKEQILAEKVYVN